VRPQAEGSEQERLEYALAYLLASTRRPRRATDLLEVSRQVAVAREILGGSKPVAERLGLSGEMIREFASVDKLCAPVKELIRAGEIKGVDVAYRLSTLPPGDQLAAAQEYVAGRLSPRELRKVVSAKKENPAKPIRDLLHEVRGARPLKRYLIRFHCPGTAGVSDRLLRRFSAMVGQENIADVRITREVCALLITPQGENRLREEARRRRVSKRRLVSDAVREE
jgi:hypothetical protein